MPFPTFLPNIFGAYESRDLPLVTVTPGAVESQVLADMRAWADLYGRTVELFTGLLARTDTVSGGVVDSIGDVGGEMQPYTEEGAVEATRGDESGWPWFAPIRRYRDRQVYTMEYLAVNTLQTLLKDVMRSTIRNYATRLKMIMRAILGNADYTFNDKSEFPGEGRGPQTIWRLFNNDSRAGYITVNNVKTAVGTLQNYVTSGSATVIKAQLTLGRTKLRAMRITRDVVHIISPTDADTVRAMAGFVSPIVINPAVRLVGDAVGQTVQPILTRPESIGAFNDGGVTDGEVIAFPFFPAGYTLSIDRAEPVPIVIRERPEAMFRGFRLVDNTTGDPYGPDHLRNRTWEYIAGAGIENAQNGVVVQAAVSGTYTAPTI